MLSPELLAPQTELVDCLLEQTKNMEENLMAISKSDFRFALHRMEVIQIYKIHFGIALKAISGWENPICSHIIP